MWLRPWNFKRSQITFPTKRLQINSIALAPVGLGSQLSITHPVKKSPASAICFAALGQYPLFPWIFGHEAAGYGIWCCQGATKSVYAPEPFDIGRMLQAEILVNGQQITLSTTGPIDPAAGLGSYVEALVRKHDTEFNLCHSKFYLMLSFNAFVNRRSE